MNNRLNNMFQLATLIGIYSYLIFFLGITHILYKEIIISVTIGFAFLTVFIFRRELIPPNSLNQEVNTIKKDKKNLVILSLIGTLIIVNLIGALGPELAFDALWYHLTLPKLYLLNHAVYHIPGGLLYYSDMPKLGELLYVGALAFGNEITAKVLHLIFGVLTSIVIYRISRKFFTPFISLIAVSIFFSNLVIAWESITAYIDLIRAFFEVMALWAFIHWWKLKENKWLFGTAIMVGFAIATKLLAVGSLIIFSILILYKLIKDKKSIEALLPFSFITLLIPLPWFIFAFIHTGNPVYPIFSDIFAGVNTKVFDIALLNPLHFLTTIWNVFTHANDPLSPVYIIFLPLLILVYKKVPKELKILYGYSLIALCVWYMTSQVEGSRLLVPYLPAFSILCAATLAIIQKEKNRKLLQHLLLGIILLVALTTAGYRFIANSKYIPVIIGSQTKQEFLAGNLNFSFGDFYDLDGYFAKNIQSNDKVLLLGFHNLYYVDFPYIHSSWIKKDDRFNYIATQDAVLPARFKKWKLVYENEKTHVVLYSDGGKQWRY